MFASLIDKESITEHRFIRYEALARYQDKGDRIRHRRIKLEEAVRIGKNFGSKIRITFETEKGTFQVETTVWAATDKYVTLKSGIVLPVSAITEVCEM